MSLARRATTAIEGKTGARQFVRTVISSFSGTVHTVTKGWSAWFWLLALLSILTGVLELTGDAPALWYVFMLAVASATITIDIIKLRQNGE